NLIERAAGAAQRQIERECNERALGVVAHYRVRRVLILPVKLDPRVEARVGDALPMAAGRTQHVGDRAAEKLEIALVVDEAAAYEREVVVVGGDPFERPELARVALAREIVWHERGGLDALDVPAMEVFVARESEQVEVVVGDVFASAQRQLVAAAKQAGARPVLEAAMSLAYGRDLKQIAVERRATS